MILTSARSCDCWVRVLAGLRRPTRLGASPARPRRARLWDLLRHHREAGRAFEPRPPIWERRRSRAPRAGVVVGHGSVMGLEGELKRRIERALGVVDDHGTRGTRLLEDAQRFCARVRRLAEKGLLPP